MRTYLTTCRTGKKGLCSLSQPTKARVRADSAVSNSGSWFWERWRREASLSDTGKVDVDEDKGRKTADGRALPCSEAQQRSSGLPALERGSWDCSSCRSRGTSPGSRERTKPASKQNREQHPSRLGGPTQSSGTTPTEPASMRKAPSRFSFSTDSCSTLGWGTVRSLMFKAP